MNAARLIAVGVFGWMIGGYFESGQIAPIYNTIFLGLIACGGCEYPPSRVK